MILDKLLSFSGGLGGAAGFYDTPTTGTQQAPNILDLGVASGVPSSANGGGARDLGIGDNPALELLIRVCTAFAGGTSLQAQLQGAPDDGTGVPGTWTTMWTSPAVALADMDVGADLANIMVPRPAPGQAMPRFLRLNYVSVGTFTGGGTVSSQIVLDRDNQPVGPSAAYSGYPAGITIAN